MTRDVGVLSSAYTKCEAINRAHGRSYYLATRLLPARKRPHVYALYGFTRWSDEIVDSLADEPPESRHQRLEAWADEFATALGGGAITDPLLPAVVHTIRSYGLDPEDFEEFLRSMAMDLKIAEYERYEDLLGYMAGSAAAIGTMMMPILGLVPGADPTIARTSARELGNAFQLTNFIRDVREDLERGRVYLPGEDLDRFGLTRAVLERDAERGRTSPGVRMLIAYERERALRHYAAALPGLALLEPRSRVCIRAAYLLYGGILAEVRRMGYDVMAARARVPRHRRLRMVVAAGSEPLFRAWIRGWGVR